MARGPARGDNRRRYLPCPFTGAGQNGVRPLASHGGRDDGDLDCGVDCGGRLLVVLHLYGEGIMMEARYLLLMVGAVAVSTLITVWALMWVLQ